jgi:hypothetical protein
MTLKRMQVTDFRCVHHADFELECPSIVIHGRGFRHGADGT